MFSEDRWAWRVCREYAGLPRVLNATIEQDCVLNATIEQDCVPNATIERHCVPNATKPALQSRHLVALGTRADKQGAIGTQENA